MNSMKQSDNLFISMPIFFILRFDAMIAFIGTNLSPFRGIQDVFLCKVISYNRYFPKKRVDNFIFRRLCICLLINMETLIKVFIFTDLLN